MPLTAWGPGLFKDDTPQLCFDAISDYHCGMAEVLRVQCRLFTPIFVARALSFLPVRGIHVSMSHFEAGM